jgi:hypothetical protein
MAVVAPTAMGVMAASPTAAYRMDRCREALVGLTSDLKDRRRAPLRIPITQLAAHVTFS